MDGVQDMAKIATGETQYVCVFFQWQVCSKGDG